MIIYQSFVNIV